MPVEHDPFTQIINVQWGGLEFLYSDGDGMFRSTNGTVWTKLKSSVPAISLAWIDGVWIAAGVDKSWRSEDGAKTWKIIAQNFNAIAAMMPKPGTRDPEGRELKRGIFAGWAYDESGDNQKVYVSTDLGKEWSVTKTIPTTVGEDGYESVTGISGCGGAIFVGTTRGATATHGGDAMFYISTNGHNYSSRMVFGPGIDIGDDATQFPRAGFGAGGVAFDAETKTYLATGQKDFTPIVGTRQSFMLYTKSKSPDLPRGEAIAVSVTGGGEAWLGAVASAAGGNGKFVSGYLHFEHGGNLANSKAIFIPGQGQLLQSLGSPPNGFLGSFCFNEEAATEPSTDDPNPRPGAFACVTFGDDGSGGAYIASGGGNFRKTHTGKGIDRPSGQPPIGAIAVGQVS
jgi:hypothetical protein